jgi:hypothetical protein
VTQVERRARFVATRSWDDLSQPARAGPMIRVARRARLRPRRPRRRAGARHSRRRRRPRRPATLGLENVMFEAAEPEVFSWHVKNCGPELNPFVDHGVPSLIVVGIDESERAEAALRFPFEEARLHRATLRVVHAGGSTTSGRRPTSCTSASSPAPAARSAPQGQPGGRASGPCFCATSLVTGRRAAPRRGRHASPSRSTPAARAVIATRPATTQNEVVSDEADATPPITPGATRPLP